MIILTNPKDNFDYSLTWFWQCPMKLSPWHIHTDWFQEFFSNNSLFWRYNLELSNSRFVWPYIYLKSPRNFRKPHGKFSEPFYIENTKFHFNIMTEISTFFGPDFLCHWMPLNFCLKYLCNWQLMYARAKILAQNGNFGCFASLKGQKWAKIAEAKKMAIFFNFWVKKC